jgi:hypothetical protein
MDRFKEITELYFLFKMNPYLNKKRNGGGDKGLRIHFCTIRRKILGCIFENIG